MSALARLKPKVTSSIEFEAMLENMTESSSDEEISLHSTGDKANNSLSPRTTEAVFSQLLEQQEDEESSSAAFSPPEATAVGLGSPTGSPAKMRSHNFGRGIHVARDAGRRCSCARR